MSRRANSVMFGFDFQENAAIVLMIENMSEMESVKVEGEEDIEIRLNDGSCVLAQAKSIVKASTDFGNVRLKAKDAIESLSESSTRVMARELIYYTNSPNPFKDEASRSMFYGPSKVRYHDLPEITKGIIDNWLSQIDSPLDTSRFKIQVLPFETDDDDQKYKVVLEKISDFIGEMNLHSIDGLKKRLHEVWLTMMDRNGAKSDQKINLKKKDVIWPIIVFATGRGRLDRNALYCTDLDDGEFEEIEYKYGELIDSYTERFDLVLKVITEYTEGEYKGRQAIESFVNDHWFEYIDELGLRTVDESVRTSLTKIVLYTVLKKRIDINAIKISVNL